MIIAVIDTRNQPDRCADIVRKLLPRSACLITPTVGDIWNTEAPVPPLSGILVHGAGDDLDEEDQHSLTEMAKRFPLCLTTASKEDLSLWALHCADFSPQLPRQPDRLPWKTAVTVSLPGRGTPRMCTTDNVSLGGVYVSDPRAQPALGDQVSLRFSFFASPVTATAVVRWLQPKDTAARPAGYGCQFVDTQLWVSAVLVNAARTQAAGDTPDPTAVAVPAPSV